MTSRAEEHLYELLKEFHTAMMVTHHGPGMHARPMAVARVRPDADLYFATSIESPKVREIEDNPGVTVVFQSGTRFAVVQGTAAIATDKALIDKLWSESWRLWFPGGKDDPKLCLVRVDATSAEYWDRSGAEGLKFLFEGLKAVVQGRTPDIAEPERHGRVTQMPGVE